MKDIKEYLLESESSDIKQQYKGCKTFGQFISIYLRGENENVFDISDLTKDDVESMDLGYTLFGKEDLSYEKVMQMLKDMEQDKISDFKIDTKNHTIQFKTKRMSFDLDYC